MGVADKQVPLLAIDRRVASERHDDVACEEPLEIRAEGPSGRAVPIAVTMRTPGDDAELAVGFLFTEGLIGSADDLARPALRELALVDAVSNVATVRLLHDFDASRLQRNFYATSSCGVCGKASIDHIEQQVAPIESVAKVEASLLCRLPELLRREQRGFARTGGAHATAAFRADGTLVCVREDVGRHNAMDKVVGRLVLDRQLASNVEIFLVSGRASFELVQKAAMAGIPIVAAISAPSSLAIDAARRFGITLVGFLRGETFNVYSHAERIDV